MSTIAHPSPRGDKLCLETEAFVAFRRSFRPLAGISCVLGEGFAREMQNVEKTIRRATASTVPEPQRPSGRISRNDNAARGVQVVQNIYANETSYAQQQREAAKQFRLIAREVMG